MKGKRRLSYFLALASLIMLTGCFYTTEFRAAHPYYHGNPYYYNYGYDDYYVKPGNKYYYKIYNYNDNYKKPRVIKIYKPAPKYKAQGNKDKREVKRKRPEYKGFDRLKDHNMKEPRREKETRKNNFKPYLHERKPYIYDNNRHPDDNIFPYRGKHPPKINPRR